MHRRSLSLSLPLAALWLALGCTQSSPGPSPGPDCQGATQACGGRCVVVGSDDLNCGACGHACTAGTTCAAGQCLVPTRTVVTTLGIDHWLDDGSRVATALPGAGVEVAALVPDAGGQGYRVLPGTVSLDGAVAVPDVPVGDYLLRLRTPYQATVAGDCNPDCQVVVDLTDTTLVQLSTSTPALGRLVASRPDLQRTTQPTPVQVDVTGLDPTVDPALAVSPQLWVGSAQADLDALLGPNPAPGATSVSRLIDWAGLLPDPVGLPSAASQDVVAVNQRIRGHLAGGSPGATLAVTTRYAELSDLTILDGVGGTLSVALAPVARSSSVALRLGGAEYAAALAGSAPGVSAPYLYAGVYAAPHAVGYPAPTPAMVGGLPYTPGPWARLFFAQDPEPPSGELDLGTIQYGGFLGAGWEEFLRVGMTTWLTLSAPGQVLTVDASPVVSSDYPAGAYPAGRIVPVLGPPGAPTVAGRDAWSQQVGVGETPRLTWTAPTLGAPDAYDLAIVPLDPRDDGLSARLHGVLTFRVPPGILKTGHLYFARITAVGGPGYGPELDPFIASLPRHAADCVTELFSP